MLGEVEPRVSPLLSPNLSIQDPIVSESGLPFNAFVIDQRKESNNIGSIVCEVSPTRDAEVLKDIASLYVQQSAIEHLANIYPDGVYVDSSQTVKIVTEETRIKDIQDYFIAHPQDRLFVTVVPDKGVVGTAMLTENGKVEKVVVDENCRRQGFARQMIKEIISIAFSGGEDGGLGLFDLQLGVIQNVNGTNNAIRAFEELGFLPIGSELEAHRKSWSNEEGKMIPRTTVRMILQKYF